ncbi:CinA family protein [Phototrophicus methaneseepsis]|uniref:CinA family protein n=1 Tax=Phototrophicus methaneseepsis TaxID=2710758 RepID=A0A7S8IDG7_9CHLR|nr:CinA family protein [Phototrophicus methaneseepsis]QPC82575.1 CinA family protein [Phototrophicus methaneseepsis]
MTQNSNSLMDLAEGVGQSLLKNKLTVCAAESCTGGLLLSYLTDVPGSSAYVLGGAVTYSNEAKMKLVNVQESTLIAYGAVSEPTAHEMAVGVRALFGADIGVSITGIAGPGGGTPEKPVGLVYVGVSWVNNVQIREYRWESDRAGNKLHSVQAALEGIQAAIEQIITA